MTAALPKSIRLRTLNALLASMVGTAPQLRSDVDAVLLVTPAQSVRAMAAIFAPVLRKDAPIAVCAKGVERGIVLDLERDLALLVAEHPAFVGPGGFDHARLDTELKSVRALLAVMPEHDVPTPADPTATAAPEAATAVTVP